MAHDLDCLFLKCLCALCYEIRNNMVSLSTPQKLYFYLVILKFITLIIKIILFRYIKIFYNTIIIDTTVLLFFLYD